LPYYYGPNFSEDDDEEKNEIMAETLSGGRVSVRLRVRFSIGGPAQQADAVEKAAPVASKETSK
jgi:hypothetical protein